MADLKLDVRIMPLNPNLSKEALALMESIEKGQGYNVRQQLKTYEQSVARQKRKYQKALDTAPDYEKDVIRATVQDLQDIQDAYKELRVNYNLLAKGGDSGFNATKIVNQFNKLVKMRTAELKETVQAKQSGTATSSILFGSIGDIVAGKYWEWTEARLQNIVRSGKGEDALTTNLDYNTLFKLDSLCTDLFGKSFTDMLRTNIAEEYGSGLHRQFTYVDMDNGVRDTVNDIFVAIKDYTNKELTNAEKNKLDELNKLLTIVYGG